MKKKDQAAPKLGTSFRLSAESRNLLALLADHLGVSQAGVLEMLIRERARREKITLRGKDGEE